MARHGGSVVNNVLRSPEGFHRRDKLISSATEIILGVEVGAIISNKKRPASETGVSVLPGMARCGSGAG